MESAAEAADRLREEGFTLIPLGAPAEAPPEYFIDQRCGGDFNDALLKWPKTPRIQWLEFQHREPGEREWLSWRRQWPTCNYAIVTGRQINVVDADSQEAMRWIEAGNITRPQRWVDTAKGRHYYYAVGPVPVRNSAGKNKIDLRGQGGYVVAAGSVHLTGVIYTEGSNPAWPDISPAGLPSLTEADLRAIAAYNSAGQPAASNVAQFPIHQSLVGMQAEVGQRNTALAASVGAWINEGIGYDQLRAKAHAWNRSLADPLTEAEVDNTILSILATHTRKHAPEAARAEVPVSTEDYRPQVFIAPSGASIPRRKFVGGNFAYPRGTATTIVGAGGSAKSSLTLVEAIGLATGRALLHGLAGAPARVWIMNFEDPIEELHRRLVAIMQHYGITQDDLGDRLMLTSGMGASQPFVTATQTRDGVVIIEPVFEAMQAHIQQHRIDAVTIDPYVSTHRIPENDNGAMDDVAKRWARLAFATNTCIQLVHHTRKTSGREATIEDARGGSSLIGAVRLGRVVSPMPEDMASKQGVIDGRWRYFCVTDGKANLTPRSDKAPWFRLESVRLPNGDASAPGDSVGVVTAWKAADPFEEMTTADLSRVLVGIRSGEWKYDRRGKGEWAGKLIGQVCGIDITDEAGVSQVMALLNTWIEKGVLAIEVRNDRNRNPRKFVCWGPNAVIEKGDS